MHKYVQTKSSVVKRIVRRIGDRGLRSVAAVAWHRSHERLTDWRLGIETRGFIDLELGEFCQEYEGTDYRLLNRAFQLLSDVEEDVVFLDYGCGKGRTVARTATVQLRCDRSNV